MGLTTRSAGIISLSNEYTFHILGCGAIGSSAALNIARMGGLNFCLYDMDKVEDVNVGVSQYYNDDIGKKKVDALHDHIERINEDAVVYRYCERFSEYYPQEGKEIVILGFDSMESRLDAVEVIAGGKWPKPICIIDGRMGAQHFQMYIINKINVKEYKKTWYPDDEGDPEPCNMKATSYCSSMTGSFIANAVKQVVTNNPYSKELTFNFPTLMLGKSKLS